ncbi:MAG: hypothetical protein MK028_01810 [Dehalococcoidia bacterium]|nr:hypothetical protein [Dehalococcoidia bacterium]
MKHIKRILMPLLLTVVLGAVACSSADPTSTPAPAPVNTAVPTDTPKPPETAKILAFSNSSPHISVIDAESNMVLETKDMENFTKWTWNDDNNYFDGNNVWLGLKYPENDDAVVISLDVNTLEETSLLSVGKEAKNIYIGKATKSGILHVGKQGSAEVVTIDTKAATVLETWENMPVTKEDGVVCDADVGIGPDGVERFYYPTRKGDSVISVNTETGEVIQETLTPDGSNPLMHTNAPDGNMWVQEVASNTNAIFDAITLELLARIPAASKPVVGTFSPDGTLAYIGHSGDPIVQVIDTKTLKEVTRVTVGSTPSKIAVHPNGKYIYAIASKEASIVIVDTSNWSIAGRIELESNPGGMFLWSND